MRIRRVLIAPVAAVFALSGCSLLGGATVEELQVSVGECVNTEAFDTETETEVGALPTVDCAEEHDAEVYFVLDLPEGDLPADAEAQAEAACRENYESYVGVAYEDSRYYYSFTYPTQSSWDMGDRQVACMLLGEVDEKLTGSLKGAAA
ncbi:septum formation family protein [Demequina sp.]|uniref:septum formation family protein n=1 Tax=Demequina sp. TaxID=2050685 RepID=UPI003A887F5A